MKDNKVGSVTVDEWLANLSTKEWLIPQFQRDFVWSIAECADFAQSVLEERPIGMVTIWEQPDNSELELGPIELLSGQQSVKFSTDDDKPKRFYAVLDGRQRSQAIAMVFGGLRSSDRRSKFAGRFFLDTTELEDTPKVTYVQEAALERKNLLREVDFIAPDSSRSPVTSRRRAW